MKMDSVRGGLVSVSDIENDDNYQSDASRTDDINQSDASRTDDVNQSDASRTDDVNKLKKKSKTLNRLRKLKKTGITLQSNCISPRPPHSELDDTSSLQSRVIEDEGLENNSISNTPLNVERKVQELHEQDDTKINTPLTVNSAFVANVSFGSKLHQPSPPPRIVDGMSNVSDKPKPVPRRRLITSPLSHKESPPQNINGSRTQLNLQEVDDLQLESTVNTTEYLTGGYKSSSTINIRDLTAFHKPVSERKLNVAQNVLEDTSKKTNSAMNHNLESVTDIQQMGLDSTCKRSKLESIAVDAESKQSEAPHVEDTLEGVEEPAQEEIDEELSSEDSDDIVIPIYKSKKSFNQPEILKTNDFKQLARIDRENGDTFNNNTSVISQNPDVALKTSTPAKIPESKMNGVLPLSNENSEESDSDSDLVIAPGKSARKTTTQVKDLVTSQQDMLNGHDRNNELQSAESVSQRGVNNTLNSNAASNFSLTSMTLPVKQIVETKSAFIVKSSVVPQTPSQESGVESDQSIYNSQEELSSEPGPSSTNSNRLPPIHSKHLLPPLSQNIASNSLRTSYKIDGNYHLRDGARTDSMAYSEPVMAADDSLSITNHSFMSTGALPTLTTKALKNRSFLSGGLQTTNSLLGKEELERYFPDRQLKIFIATWNMHSEKDIPRNLQDLLLPDDCVFVQDIYAIGTQESCPDKQEWEVSIQQVLGHTHVLLHSASHGVLHLLIFIRRDLIWFCSPVEEDRVSTRVGAMIKTKGAMALAFNFFGTSLLFIASHLTSGDEKLKERILDYEKIISTLQLPVKDSPIRSYNKSSSDVTAKFDCVFWCGDFNFRLDLPKERVENWIAKMKMEGKTNMNKLLKEDQLIKEMKNKGVFNHFNEDEIRFFPSYKFDLKTDNYDTSPKARVPSYTDRILYRSRKSGDIQALLYNCCEAIQISDHRPVYAIFTTKIRPGRHDMVTGGGQFMRNVFVEGNKRRAVVLQNENASSVCVIL